MKKKSPAPADVTPEPNATIPNDLMTADEAGELLRVSGASVRRWVNAGKLPGYRAGANIRVSREDVAAFLRRTKPAKGPMPRTAAELRAEDEETDRILREFRVRTGKGRKP